MTLQNVSLTNLTVPSSSLPTSGQLLSWIVADLLSNSVGAVVNLILLLAFVIHAPLRHSSSFALIVHCVIIDLYTCTVAVPVGAIYLYLGAEYPRSREFCRYLPLWVYLIYPCEAWSTLFLALHRLAAALTPQHFAKLKTRPIITAMIVAPWCTTLCIVSWQTLPGSQYTMVPGEAGGCVYFIGDRRAAFLSSLFGTYLPTALTGASYAIFLVKTFHDLQRREGSPALQRRMEISRTLMLSFLWHCVALYPAVIVVSVFSSAYNSNPALRLGIRWLLDSLSALNPVR